MNKVLRSMMGLILLGVLFSGCATTRETYDLADYINHGVLKIAQLEEQSLAQYAAVTGDNFTTEERLLMTLKAEVIPLYKKFLDGLGQIKPETDEVKNLHKFYLRGGESLYQGFTLKLTGLEKGDDTLIRLANERIEKGRQENELWREHLAALAAKYGLELKYKEGP